MKLIYDERGRLSEITFAENDNQEAICKMIENMQKNVCDTQKNYHDKYFEVQKNYIDKNSTALTEPSVNIKVDIADTLKKLENCKLCDTVQVYFEPLGFSANAKIVRTEYDSLLEKYTKIELGTMKKTIADLFSGKNIGGA